ncbi:MAG: hypothetical protein QW757_06110, partial [Candidatus Woesearchaeota archaeon]
MILILGKNINAEKEKKISPELKAFFENSEIENLNKDVKIDNNLKIKGSNKKENSNEKISVLIKLKENNLNENNLNQENSERLLKKILKNLKKTSLNKNY